MTRMSKKLMMTGVAFAATGLMALNNTETASAATWEARTVAEISADIENTTSGEENYTIKWGDTLGSIAKALDIKMNKLVEINDINNADLIIAGTKISLSSDGETVTYSEPTTGKEKSYNVSEKAEHVEEVEEPVESTEPAQAEESTEVEAVEETEETTQSSDQNESNTQEETTSTDLSGSESEAKEIIANRESGGSYDARNGRYIGRYQLDSSYLNGDYSAANQESVADQYVSNRYGSWQNALTFWNQNGWY